MRSNVNKSMHLDTEMPQIGNSYRQSRPATAKTRMPTAPSAYFDKAGPRKMPAVMPKAKGMGKYAEKEELYDETMKLKRTLNSLKRELEDTKSQVVKQELTLRKKDKIIEDLSKENDVEDVRKDNIKRAQDSTIVSLVKRKYKELQKGFNDLKQENEILKANTKLTKIKEIQIETEVMKEEMKKIKSLYKQSALENECKSDKLNEINEVKSRFAQQHKIIRNLQETCDNSQNEIKDLKREIDTLKEKLNKREELLKKKKIEIQTLKVKNQTYLDEKKTKETYTMGYNEYMQRLNDLNEKNQRLSVDYKKRETECMELKKTLAAISQKLSTPMSPIINSYNVQGDKLIQSGEPTVNNTKMELLSSLVKDLTIKCNIYEKYLKEQGEDVNTILKDNGYEGVISHSTEKRETAPTKGTEESPSQKKKKNSEEEQEGNGEETSNEINRYGTFGETNGNGNGFNTNGVLSSKTGSNFFNSHDNMGETDGSQQSDSEIYLQENVFAYVIMRNLEANKQTNKKELTDKANEIYQSFVHPDSDQTESPTQEQFVEPFANFLLEKTNSKDNEEDRNYVMNSLISLMADVNNDTTEFISKVYSMFEQIEDQSYLEDEREKILRKSLKEKKKEFLDKVEVNEEDGLIVPLLMFKRFYDEVNPNLNDDDFNFLIYKMKLRALKKNARLIDIDTEYFKDLFNLPSSSSSQKDSKNDSKIKMNTSKDRHSKKPSQISNQPKKFTENDNSSVYLETLTEQEMEEKYKKIRDFVIKERVKDLNAVFMERFKYDHYIGSSDFFKRFADDPTVKFSIREQHTFEDKFGKNNEGEIDIDVNQINEIIFPFGEDEIKSEKEDDFKVSQNEELLSDKIKNQDTEEDKVRINGDYDKPLDDKKSSKLNESMKKSNLSQSSKDKKSEKQSEHSKSKKSEKQSEHSKSKKESEGSKAIFDDEDPNNNNNNEKEEPKFEEDPEDEI
ncbi:MAG: hypothetical protein MJ252_10985 [archaeon]|nr:hypothetical protein [archaeon]